MNPYVTQNMQNPYLQQNNPYYNSVSNNYNIKWVQGIEGAKAFQIPSSSNVVLFDSENDGIFYIKISDNVGMCTLRAFKYEEIKQSNNQQPQVDMSEYVKKSELESLVNSMLGGTK